MTEQTKLARTADTPFSPRVWAFLLIARQALIMLLGGLEDLMNLERTREPNHKRK
jgi:hypothetical protein